ncbi:MAG: hypothetical protein E7620_02050 [Ruminococcaceae bacterium]|nr:hypothetical protein [Oscillospiraceae bacterium]
MGKDQTVLAHCNLFGVLGAIPELLRIDEEARALVKGQRISIGFSVKNGPRATLFFENGNAVLREGCGSCSIKLYFSSPEKFNGMIDGTAMPLPVSGFFRLGFLLKNFTKLTDILSSYLRPAEGALENPEFLVKSTKLMLHVIAGSVAQIGCVDPVGRFSASNIVDGDIKISIGDPKSGGAAIAVSAKDHRLQVLESVPEVSFSEMSFADYQTARDLFDGKINAVAAVGTGKVRIFGMISQIDNVNRILDRVSLYLA